MLPTSSTPRVGLKVIDKTTQKPLAGATFVGVARTTGGDEISLGALATDHVGYAAFDLRGLAGRDDIQQIVIRPFGDATDEIDIGAISPTGGPVVIPLDPPMGTHPTHPVDTGLPSIQNPCEEDWLMSPGSFAVNPDISIGQGGCELLIPRNFSEHEFRFTQVLRDPIESRALELAAADACTSGGEFQEPPPRICVRSGTLLTYIMTWTPFGHSLGRLVYSLPLAPCESVNLAVIDWSRNDETVRNEDTSVTEQLLHRQFRDRTIEETVRASVTEWQRGGSLMGGSSIVAPISEGLSLGLSLGGGYSTSSGSKEVEGETVQRLSDSVVQASTAMRRLNSTVVVQARQHERESIETRTVTNHNHCHALTILYYEVLRHYRVVSRLLNRRKVLFIKHYSYQFDEVVALNYRVILESALLDRRLDPCFNALQKLHCSRLDAARESTLPKDDPGGYVFLNMRATIKTGDDGTDSDPYVNLILRDGNSVRCQQIEASDTGDRYRLGHVDYDDFESGDKDEYGLRPDRPIAWSELGQVEVGLDGGDNWRLQHLKLIATGPLGEDIVLFDEDINITLSNSAIRRPLIRPKPVGRPLTPEDQLTAEERCCVNRLLEHLNTFNLFYSRAIWLQDDPAKRAILFDKYKYMNGRLLDYIENCPVGVIGDYVAFPYLPPRQTSTTPNWNPNLSHGGGANINILPHVVPFLVDEALPAPITRVVSVPTRGLFAESQLSHCNACEELDVTRFWDWSKCPCPEKAPEITGVEPESRAMATDTTPTTLPAPIVNIMSPPNAPDPAGLAAAMTLLGKGDVFRDMSGRAEVAELLKGLTSGTMGLAEAKLKAEEASDAIAEGATNGGGGAAGGGETVSPENQHARLQVLRNAEAHGDIDEATRQRLAARMLEESSPRRGGPPPQSFSVRYDVPLVPQLTELSCWAAGAAMIVAWRDNMSINPSEIAAATGYWAQYHGGLDADDPSIFPIWGMVPEPAQTYSVEAFRGLLERFGPLWVASAEPGPHIRVVTGIEGDGTADGTYVLINDPWQIGMATFSMPNYGSQYRESYAQFERKQRSLASTELHVQGIYVAHLQ